MKTRILAVLTAIALLAAAQTPDRRGAIHVLLTPIPATLTIPTSDEGRTLNRSIVVDVVVLSNTDTVAHTATVQDCQTTPGQIANAVSIPAGTVFTYPLNGIRFGGCFKWSASSTTVQGAVTGE